MQADGNPINALPEDPAILQALLLSAWSERDRIAVERNELAEQTERLQHLVLQLTRLKSGPDVRSVQSTKSGAFYVNLIVPKA